MLKNNENGFRIDSLNPYAVLIIFSTKVGLNSNRSLIQLDKYLIVEFDRLFVEMILLTYFVLQGNIYLDKELRITVQLASYKENS